ncbi:glycoside hydrolase 15 protein, partial [Irineochytrium annulatum]
MQVALVGNLQHLAACDDWSPACPNTVFTAPTDDPFYRFSLAIPQGYFEYKVAIGGSWAINYGDFGRRDGPNVPLGVESDSTVNFYYNSATNHLYDTVANPVTYVAGTFQTALGCTSNDDLNCLAGQLTDFAFSGTSTFVAHLPAGPHSVSLARTAVPAASVLASSVAFTVPADGASVTFSLQGTTFSVAVAGGQTVSVQITSTTPTSTGTTGPTPTGTCVHTPRSYYLTVPVQHTFSEYVGNVFFGELRVLNIGNPKTVTVNYADAVGNWGNQCGTSYGSGPYESNYEVWKFSCTIGAAGISQFNVQYDVNGNTYFDNNGGSNFLITAKQPAPFTHGFQRDISHYFQQEVPRAIKYMLQAISPANTSIGVVVAAPKKQVLNQNYFYHWIRDA